MNAKVVGKCSSWWQIRERLFLRAIFSYHDKNNQFKLHVPAYSSGDVGFIVWNKDRNTSSRPASSWFTGSSGWSTSVLTSLGSGLVALPSDCRLFLPRRNLNICRRYFKSCWKLIFRIVLQIAVFHCYNSQLIFLQILWSSREQIFRFCVSPPCLFWNLLQCILWSCLPRWFEDETAVCIKTRKKGREEVRS